MSILRSSWHLIFSNNISTSKKAIDKFGGFDDNFKGWGLEDTEFGYRLYKNGVKIIYNPNIEVIHQYHEYSFDDKRYTQWNRNFEFFVKKHPDIPVLLQGILKEFFDPGKRAVKEQKGIQHVWLHSYIKFENALRCLDDRPAIKTGSSGGRLIVHAAYRKSQHFTVVIFVQIAVTEAHVMVPRVSIIVFPSRPPVTVAAKVVEYAIEATVAARKCCKSTLVRSASMGAFPMCYSFFFHFATSDRHSSKIRFEYLPIFIGRPMPACGTNFTTIDYNIPVVKTAISVGTIWIIIIIAVSSG